MCFENLPVRFDADGRAHLADDHDFTLTRAPRGSDGAATPAEAPGTAFSIDPVTRIAGAMAFHTSLDLDERVVVAARTEAVMFRGYEVLLRGREPEEAIHISSRACGVCGGVHATCASMALEMLAGVPAPPPAIVLRNLGQAAELVYDHCLHLFLLAGPDYSEQMVAVTNPSWWTAAQRTPAPNAAVHGRRTIAEIMRDLNPLTGALAREALEATRSAREVVSLLFGKYPHPSAIVPAGLTTRVDRTVLNQVLARLVRLLDFAKVATTVWDDLVEFLYEVEPDIARVGLRRANLLSTGIFDDPDVYDADYATVDAWGAARRCPPGAIVDGALRTSSLRQIVMGIEEFVSHSYYDDWTDGTGSHRAPDGSPVSPYHPLNKRTIPRPDATGFKQRYSWSTAPRWDRLPMESGPLARQWAAVAVGLPESNHIRTRPGGLELKVPAGEGPALDLLWRLPPAVNALERNRARAFHISYCLLIAYEQLLAARGRLSGGPDDLSAPWEVVDGVGMGLWEAGRGTLAHFCEVVDGRISNYQILTPSTWMASPRDPWDGPGPYEEGVVGTPILEETTGDDFVGVDVLRAVRSFDPCMPCAVHLHTGGGTIVRDATTCACGTDA